MQASQEYSIVPIDSLEPHPDNPNRGDVERIRRSIQGNDWYGVVTVQRHPRRKQLRILAGEHRWRAAQAEGATEIPVVIRDIDDVVALRILLADNETARHAAMDYDAQRACLEMLAEIDDEDIIQAGFDLDEAIDLIQAHSDPQPDPLPDPLPEDDDDDSGFNPQFGILVVCDGERQQEKTFNQIVDAGIDPTLIRAVSI